MTVFIGLYNVYQVLRRLIKYTDFINRPQIRWTLFQQCT